MKIDYLKIRSPFKNLNQVYIDFDENNPMTVIVGQNGSGKSNVLEAVAAVFESLNLALAPPFSYELKYILDDSLMGYVLIEADAEKKGLKNQYKIKHLNKSTQKIEELSFAKFKRDEFGNSPYLPQYIFGYYSGISQRLEKYFKSHQAKFYQNILNHKVDHRGRIIISENIRHMFYASPIYSQFILLSFFMEKENTETLDFLNKHFGIEDLDSVHIVLNKPDWSNKKEDRFWGAVGVIRDFLNVIFESSLAPIKIKRAEEKSLTGRDVENEYLHLFIENLDRLKSLSELIDPKIFFALLEASYLSGMISEVRIRLRLTGSAKPVSLQELSEGEQQLLTVLGLLKFTGGKDSLFLLDEPDTHLNPAWSVKYLSFLRQFIPSHTGSHVLMVTHHPLTIAELEKEQIQVMWADEQHQVHAKEPEISPQGMGYSGILTSDMFGLTAALDIPTMKRLEEKRQLIGKDSPLTDDERKKLKTLNQELDDLGFRYEMRDPIYTEYLKARYLNKSLNNSEDGPDNLSQAQKYEEAKQIAKEILGNQDDGL